MQFYDSSGKTGIVDDTFFLLFGDSADHSGEYPLADIARNVNRWFDKVVTKILQSDHSWRWDDHNQSGPPKTSINLVANTQDYTITGATYLKVSRVDIKDSAGNGIQLQQISSDDIAGTALSAFQSTAGTPQFYKLEGNTISLYPKPSYSSSGGLIMSYQRIETYFTSASTTAVPGFAEPFHRILSLGAAYDYALVNGLKDKIPFLRNEITIMETDLETFYSSRNDNKLSLKVSKQDYGQTALGGNMPGGRNNQNPFGFF